MNVLGINPGHDASAALLINGQIQANVAEERFVRIKHYSGLPTNSIKYCLDLAGLDMHDIDIIAVPSNKDIFDLNYLLDLGPDRIQKPRPRHVSLNYLQRKLGLIVKNPPLNFKKFSISKKTELVHVEHHLAHAASAYYTSGTREKQLIATMDGAGDGVSIALWKGEAGQIIPLLKLPGSCSLGWFYSNVTEALGWWHGHDEGKTMGLAAYGDYTSCEGVLNHFHPKFEDGNVVQTHEFGQGSIWNEYGSVQFHFDDARKIKILADKHGREHIAAEAQRIIEHEVAQVVLPWLDKLDTKILSCAGGIFLNVKLNQKLWETAKIRQHHIFPDAGDSGLALGAALWAHYQAHAQDVIRPLHDVYHGPQYSSAEIECILKARNLTYSMSDNVEQVAAGYLAQNKIVAWFQGRMESGPRALGNRSILMSANKSENKDIINAKVKFREPFRPFCPSLLSEAQNDYFAASREENFMITSFDVNPAKKERVPAVVHVDDTARPQMVQKKVNPSFWRLIHHFGEMSGEPLVLNTSFNIKGEPIVCHPRDAIRCFYDNGLDYLIIGNYVIKK